MLALSATVLAFTASPVCHRHPAAPRCVMAPAAAVAEPVIGASAGSLVATLGAGFLGGKYGGKYLSRNKAAATSSVKPVTQAEVKAAQKLWADSIVSISKVMADDGDFIAAAGEAAGKLYGYGHGSVLFKPTKATNNPFRPTASEAMSYFVGADAMRNNAFKGEDAGFAINGGKGWKSVTFKNHQIELYGDVAHSMGEYWFVDATTGDKVRVEYTFCYKRCDDGKVRICLHHSSVPYAA